MHINLNRNQDEFTEKEATHMQECRECRDEYEILQELMRSVQSIEEIKPSESNWQVIRQKVELKEQQSIKQEHLKNTMFSYRTLMTIAASTFSLAVGWLVWSNHQMQTQLDQMLLVNQQLEQQLENPEISTYEQAYFLKEIKGLDKELSKEGSKEETIRLLKIRSKLVLELYKIQKGESDVYSI